MTRHVAMVGMATLAAACSGSPGPAATPDQTSGIARESYTAPAPLGHRISYLRAGDPRGRRVILVHGTPGSANGWVDYLEDVPAGFEYLAVDRPGFGASGPDGAVPSLQDQAEALLPLLAERGGRRPILVGHSLGGPIVARLAADHPGRVGALVILAGSLDPALERIHWAQPMGEWPGIRSALPRSLRNANRELMALKPELEQLQPLLRRIACPVIVVHGTADRLVPYANVAFMQAHFSGAPVAVETLPGRNHFLPWNEAARVRAAIARAASAAESGTC